MKYAIKIKDPKHCEDVQDILFNLGFLWEGCSVKIHYFSNSFKYIIVSSESKYLQYVRKEDIADDHIRKQEYEILNIENLGKLQPKIDIRKNGISINLSEDQTSKILTILNNG